MPWAADPVIALAEVEEATAGAGVFTTWVELKPGEGAHFHWARTDNSPSEEFIVQAFGSPDKTLLSSVPLLGYRFKVNFLTKDEPIRGDIFAVRFFFQNADGSPVEKVKALVSYKLDQVSL